MKTGFSSSLALVTASLLLAACGALKGVSIGGYNLDPVVSAGEKLANAQEVSEPVEIDIGLHMAATLVGAAPLLQDDALQRYVNRVGKLLSLHGSRPQLPWKFGVLDDRDPNAFAAPGGYVFISAGMLDLLESEAELASVLAHEITHVNEKHHLKAVQTDNLLGAATDILGAVSDQQIAKSGGKYAGLKKGAADKIVGASRQLYARGLDRDDELAADAGSLVLLQRAGYDPWAFIAVMQKLQAREKTDSGLALLLKTHPSPGARIAEASKKPALANADSSGLTLNERFVAQLK
jgi:predicted Zn-dependent protease